MSFVLVYVLDYSDSPSVSSQAQILILSYRASELTVHFDGDLSFVIATLGVDLCTACVLAVIRFGDVDDP